jgi:transposase InsO family protein
MDVHKNARTTPHSRENIVVRVLAGESARAVADDVGICESTVRKWVRRYRTEGRVGLCDRPCRPHRSPTATPRPLVQWVERLRRQRWTGAQIADRLQLSRATVARLAQRCGLARLSALTPPLPVRRYERAYPGELVHIDVKKLGRIGRVGHRITGDRRSRVVGIGWEYIHVAVDDASRFVYVEVLGDDDAPTATAFLWRARAWFRRHGIRVSGVMTDNAKAYCGHAFAALCQRLHLRHIRIQPYTPRTNGKAERFIQTLLREWAYRRPYATSAARSRALSAWLHYYNWHRRHSSLHGEPPVSRLRAANVVRLHI